MEVGGRGLANLEDHLRYSLVRSNSSKEAVKTMGGLAYAS